MENSNSQSNSLIKIIAVVLFIALPFFGFYLGMQYQNTVTPSEDQTSVNIVKPRNNTTVVADKIPVVTQTADMSSWKTYRNIQIGFSVDYPSDWKLKELTDNGKVDGIELSGYHGNVRAVWGNGLGGGCLPEQKEKVQTQGELLNSCYIIRNDGSESWSNINKQLTNTSFSANAEVNVPVNINKELVLKILSTFRFE